MNKAKAKADSSMEDVLASIKQIIADDLDNDAEDDILELTEELNETSPTPKEVKMTEKPAKAQDQPKAEPVQQKTNADFAEAIETQVESLISQDAINVSTAALRELDAYTTTVKSSIQDNSFGQKTVEDVMKEMLRPLLKEWLDAHLPSLVKWLVTEQIEKMLKNK